MKFFLVLISCFLFWCAPAQAFGRKHGRENLPKTEVELMNKVLDCFRNKDTIGYYNLFPPFDTLWKMVLHNPDQTPEVVRELSKLKEHPTVLIDFDPFYNHSILGRFVAALHKGEDSGIQWKGIVMQRYELQKMNVTRDNQGLQLIMLDRYKGFLFVRDMLSSTTYCITITEIQKIDGYFFGGQVLNVLEANTIDQYLAREDAERRYLAKLKDKPPVVKDETPLSDSALALAIIADSVYQDSIAKAGKALAATSGPVLPPDTAKMRKQLLLSVPSADDDAAKTRREVVDRKYYKGKFDDEIPVELYVRYMKDATGKANNWDALYKFGDMAKYVRLDVSKGADGKWLFEEPVATMELELVQKVYSGTWTNGGNQTGYDVELAQKALSAAKILAMDRILENKAWGKTDQQKIFEQAEKEEKDKEKKAEEEGKKKVEPAPEDKAPEPKKVPKKEEDDPETNAGSQDAGSDGKDDDPEEKKPVKKVVAPKTPEKTDGGGSDKKEAKKDDEKKEPVKGGEKEVKKDRKKDKKRDADKDPKDAKKDEEKDVKKEGDDKKEPAKPADNKKAPKKDDDEGDDD